MNDEIKAGDTVTLLGEGAVMTVNKIHGANAECTWIDIKGGMHKETIPLIALIKRPDDSETGIRYISDV